MKFKLFLLFVLISGVYLKVFGQTFPCDGRMFIFLDRGQPPGYSFWIDDQDSVIVNFNPFTPFPDAAFSAVGFNSQDNYIYGVPSNTNQIARLQANGTYDIIGSVPFVNKLEVHGGDCSPDGHFVCYDSELHQLLFFEVIDTFALVERLDLFWNPSSPNKGAFKTRIDAIAFDPLNPTVAYSYQGNYSSPETEPSFTRGNLLSINLDFSSSSLGMVTPVGPIAADEIIHMGSLFFSTRGDLFGYGSIDPLPNTKENRYIRINKNTGIGTFRRSGPAAPATDGCSCPFGLTFKKDAFPRLMDCGNSELDYELSINNHFTKSLSEITLKDTLPEGVIIEAISGNFQGQVVPGTGVGSRFLTIEGLKLPQNQVITITLKTRILGLPLGLSSSQATLSNLPASLGGSRASDDPQTDGFFDDVTLIYVGLKNLDDVEINVERASDCLNPNDGQLLITSQLLRTGQAYQIEYGPRSGELITTDILVDENQSLSLDSLTPGDYLLAGIHPKSNECGFSLNNRTVKVPPPNELVEVEATSNSPTCTGSELQLEGLVATESTISWRGPNGFRSTDLNPVITSASFQNKGTYTLSASLGVCREEKSIEVDIKAPIEGVIMGNQQFCERETLELTAHTTSDTVFYHWQGPGGLVASSDSIRVSDISLANEGTYQVIIDNGACKDTASTDILVFPSPRITLPYLIETDFCDPLTLYPQVSGGNQLKYSWKQDTGLTCFDCPSPTIQLPFQPNYQLQVTNEWLCKDSAQVYVNFVSEKLLYAPNAFSPNYDGVNDYFQLFPGCGVLSIRKLEIYDRWGNKVFAKGPIDPQDKRAFWNGLVRGELAVDGIYIWYTEIALIDGTVKRLTGEVSLMR